MKRINFVLVFIFVSGIVVWSNAQDKVKTTTRGEPNDRFAYSYGALLGDNFKTMGLSMELISLKKIWNGIEAFMNGEVPITESAAQKTLNAKMLELGTNERSGTATKTSSKAFLDDFAYDYGVVVGANWKRFNLSLKEISMDEFQEGLRAMLTNDNPKVTVDEAKSEITAKFQLIEAEKEEKLLNANKKFLKKNSEKSTIISLKSGIQYEILREGSGKQVSGLSDQVTTHYHGTLMDGKVFDSSIERDEPITFALTGVIKGWQELIPLMKEGEKIRAYIPPHMAYGNRPRANIPANSLLIFEIELLKVEE